METPGLLLLFFFSGISSLPYPALSSNKCSPSSCGDAGPEVRFPFRLKTLQSDQCGYPGFDLSCDNQSQTILNLPHAGEFVVNQIDYASQWVFINDPGFCLPKRLLNFTLSGSPFAGAYSRNFTFLNCSSAYWSDNMMDHSVPIYCLSTNHNFTVVATSGRYVLPSCQKISTVSVPISFYQYVVPIDQTNDLQLKWSAPNCESCEAEGGTCGFEGNRTKMEIGCFDLPSSVLKAPGVKKFLGVPEIPVAPLTCSAEKPALSFFEALKKYATAQKAASSPVEASKPAVDQRISSSSVISQRLRSLEKQVKGRKKSKKRMS